MEHDRSFANIGRKTGIPGQNVQHFMSRSPWSAQAVIRQVQMEVASEPGLEQGGTLILDESAVKKPGPKSAGAGRQHNGRLGKIDMSQIGVFLAYANGGICTWVDGELFIPEDWFGSKMADERRRVGIPPQRQFQTKVQLGWTMIQRARANGLPFEAVACDELYGRSGPFGPPKGGWLRREMDEAGILYVYSRHHEAPRGVLE